jgi:superfamily II DNA or RNA helicase
LRNAFIIDLVKRNPQHKIMILTWNKAHAHFLKDVLIQHGVSTDILAGNKNTYKDSRVLVATTQKITCGFDEEMSCPDWGGQKSNMMILTGSTKSLAGLEQMTGRVFRSEFPTIIDLVDDNPICRRHWTERSKWYTDPGRNGEIHYIEMKKVNPEMETSEELSEDKINSMHNKTLERIRNKAKLQIINN